MRKIKVLFTLLFCFRLPDSQAQTDTTYHYVYECDSCGVFETFSTAPIEVETIVNISTQVLPDSGKSTLATFTNINARKSLVKAESNLIKNTFNVYPNPTQGTFYLNFKSKSACAGFMQLFNMYGVELLRKEIMLKKGMNVIEEEKRNLAAGNYFIKVNFNNDTFTRKIAFKDAAR